MDGYPYFGAAGKRGNSGHERRQSILGTEVDILGGPRVVAADKSLGNICCLEQKSSANGGRSSILLLGGILVDRLRIQLSGRRDAIGQIDADAQWPHDVHPNQEGRWF